MLEELPLKKVIGATEVRNHVGTFLNRVHRGDEHLVIEKLGIPVAVVISMKDYEQCRRFLAEQMFKDLGRKMGAAAERQGLTEEKLIEQMEDDRAAVYAEMYGRKA
ncbi:MAG: type II toxin-antitoxin system Phd/YefM family antitoxin [Chloroflexi bacterium]|nr:type II toxin-antitoxin system Phd/YefM family antitoxin [Chloroflexota bacterium]